MNKLKENLYENSQYMTVLYVEDDNYIAQEVSEILRKLFKKVIFAVDGVDGLDKYAKNKDVIDLVITDIIMPNKNGIELIKEIKNIDKNILCIVISSSTDTEYLIDLISLNVDGYLMKPVRYKSLLEIVYKVLQKKILKDENDNYKNNLQKIIDKKSEELTLRYYTDSLTNLKNRTALFEDIEKYTPNKLMIIDIHRFSAINDLYGYEVGDEVLLTVKDRLEEILNSSCGLYKISADQFVFVHLDKLVEVNCQNVLQKIQSHINETSIQVIISGIEIEIFINIIVGIVKDVAKDKLFESADLALHYAKKTNQSSVVFNPEITEVMNYKKIFTAISLVKKAFEEDKIVPFFQPIVKPNETTYECLVRLIDENGEAISPVVFLDEIKETSYYTKLTRTMIDKSFEFFYDKGHSFSINLSFKDIENIDIVNYLKKNITKYKVNSKLIIEILESESIDNFETVREFIKEMKSLGIRIALDDFGSGYSNFAYILEFKPDYIKIDGSIIKNIATDKKAYVIAKTIVQFANELNIKTIAEYIYCKEVYEKVLELGIDGKQGYFVGKPEPFLLEGD